MSKRLCQLHEVYIITEYKNGAVYKTRLIGELWIPLGTPFERQNGDLIIQATSDNPAMK